MEIGGLDIDAITFACIQMRMSHLSRYSQLRFLQRCQTSPNFVGNWFNCLLSERSIQKLKKTGTKAVSFEIQMQLPMRSEGYYIINLCLQFHIKVVDLIEDLKKIFSNKTSV